MGLHQLRIYMTPWFFLSAGLLHFRTPFPAIIKTIIVCVIFRLVPVMYHANRTENILTARLWRAVKTSNSFRTVFRSFRLIFANKLHCFAFASLIARIYILQCGIADTARLAPFSDTVLYRSAGFRKGLKCLSGTSRRQERQFMIDEALNCGLFVAPKNEPAMHTYAQFVRTIDGNQSACLPETRKIKFGRIDRDEDNFAGPKNALALDLKSLRDSCEDVDESCSHVAGIRTFYNTTWVMLKSPPRRIVLHLRKDAEPNLTALREVILAEAQGLHPRVMTRILLGVMLTNQYAPCFMRGRFIEGSVKTSHLTINPGLLALLLVIEAILWNIPMMTEVEDPRVSGDPDDDTMRELVGATISDTDVFN